jgi:hypothetical protein
VDFVEIDRVGLAQDLQPLARHLAGNADGQARPGKRVPADKAVGKAEFAAEVAHLVLEQLAQRLQ